MGWLIRLLRRRRLERDLERELAFHVEAHVRDLMRSGLTRGEAEREARVQLGGVEQVKEAARDARGTRWLEDWWQDTRYALRMMRRAPVFTIAAVLTLALGIGANAAVWSIVDALMLRELPIERPSELHALRRHGLEERTYRMSHPRFRQLQAELPETVPLAAMSSVTRAYATISEQPEQVLMQLVSGEWFSLLGVGTSHGRRIGVDDAVTLGGHPVVVISHGWWERQFGRDPGIVGRTVRINGAALTVIGVAQAGFSGLTVGQSVDVWVPLVMQHVVRYQDNASSEDSDTALPWVPQDGIEWLTLIARVPRGQAARYEPVLDRRYRQELERRVANDEPAEREHELRQHQVLEPISRGISPLRVVFAEGLQALMITVALVLLIACGNLAGLLLARSASRAHEFAMRAALGARSGRLLRQVLAECVALALIGGVLGLVVAQWGGMALLRAASSGPRPIPLELRLDVRVLAFTFAISLATGILFGLAAALRVARGSAYDTVRSGDRVRGAASGRLPLGRVLVVSQIALSLVLVVSAGLFLRTFRNLMTLDPGYDTERVVAARLDVRAAGYEHEQLPALYQRLQERVGALAGVRSVSLSLHGLQGGSRRISTFEVPGRMLPPDDNNGQENYVTPEFFSTTGMVLLRGRGFSASDNADAPGVAIISESTARHFFGSDDPIGKRFGYDSPSEYEVIGIVRDARVNTQREAPPRLIFYPLAQAPQEYITSLEARVTAPAGAVLPAIRDAIASVDPQLPVREVVVLRDLVQRGLWRERLIARVAGAFGVVALLLAAIGLYGVMAYMVSRRTNEMGVRLALGARPADVRWLVLSDSLVTVAAGVTLGLILSLPLASLARNLLYGLSPRDPATTVVAAALTAVVGISAACVPAWRASRVDPLRAIRAE